MKFEEIVRLKDVWVYYEANVWVLEGVNLSIYREDFLGIIGPNGGGKTSLLKVILGLVKPVRGEVKVLGESPEKNRKFIGYVPQYNVFDREFPVSVLDVVLMGRLGKRGLVRRYNPEDEEIALDALKKVGMFDFKNRQIGKLSGGEQQRVFVARALVSQPKLLLLDEPMSNIDVSMRADFYELLESLRKQVAIVLVSHDLSAISIYVDKIACLNRRLFYHGSKEITAEELEEVYQCPIQLIAHGVFPHRVLKEHRK